ITLCIIISITALITRTERLHAEPSAIRDILIYNESSLFGDTISRTAIEGNLYIKIITELAAPQISDPKAADTCVVRILNNNTGENILLTFNRNTSGDTNSPDSVAYKYEGQNKITVKNYGWTNNTLNYIGARWDDAIKVNVVNFAFEKSITVAKPLEPVVINSLNFMYIGFQSVLSEDYRISMNEQLYFQIIAQEDAEPLMVDSIPVVLKDAAGIELFSVNLFETGKNTGIYNNQSAAVKITDITNIYEKTIKEKRGSFITVNARNLTDTIYFINPKPPTSIIDAKFTDAGFSNAFSGKRFEKPLQVQVWVQAYDLEPYYADTLQVIVQRLDSQTDSLSLTLTETSKNSGIFRTSAFFTISDATIIAQNTLKVNYGETAGLMINNALADTFLINYSFGPDFLTDLYFSNSGWNGKLPENYHIDKGENLYIEALGHSGSQDIIDTFYVILKNNRTADSITLLLTESSKNSGIYRNSQAVINNYTNDFYKWIGASYGDSITIYSVYGSFTDIIYLINPVQPSGGNIIASYFTDNSYNMVSEDSIPLNSNVKVEMLSVDMESRYLDTKTVYIKNSSNGDSIFFTISEISSGKLRSQISAGFGAYTNITENILKAAEGDVINLVIDNIIRDTAYIAVNNPIIFAASFNFINTLSLTESEVRTDTIYPPYSTINIELNGIDNNPSIENYIFVTLSNSYNDAPITLRLNETEKNSGKFRGVFYLRTFTSQYN
nr:hypothetical protein [bacterium]